MTGASSLKVGYIGNQLGDIRSANRGANDLRYRVNNGVPNQLTEYIHDQQNDLWMRNHALLRAGAVDARPADAAGRAAIRPRVELGAGAAARERGSGRRRSCSTRRRWWTATTTSRRASAVTYDLFGNGKTALKATLGKYLESDRHRVELRPRQPDVAHRAPTSRAPGPTRNGNWNPDCDLSNPQHAGLRVRRRRLLRRHQQPELRHRRPSATRSIPDILTGWGVRPSDWNWGVSVQHEVLPRVSVEVGFFHREFYGFAVTDNLAVTPADFTQFSITAPQDPRLPDGGGYQVGHAVRPEQRRRSFGVTRNYITYADRYGDAYQKFNGIDVNVSARPAQRPHRAGRLLGRLLDVRQLRGPGRRCRRSRC